MVCCIATWHLHPCITWHSITCHTPSITQYRVLRGLQLRVQGLQEVYKEGSNGCLGTYWCGWCLTGKDRWSLGSIMWVWWNRFLLDQEMQDMNHHYISHWCSPHILVFANTPPLVRVGGTAPSLLHWREGPPSAPCQSDLSRHHLWKVNITTCHALSEL